MAKPMGNGMLSNMPPKQKVIIVILIIVVLVILWQLKGLFSSGGVSSTSHPALKVEKLSSGSSVSPATTATLSSTAGGLPHTAAMPTQQSLIAEQQAFAEQNMMLMRQQQEVQAKYLNAVNELQMLKIQQEIAQANQAIATAKLATVTAEKGVSDLLTRPSAPSVPTSVYANNLVSPTQAGGEPVSQPPIQPAPTVAMEVPYVVISVSMESHRWSAVIGYQGKLYTVSTGDTLPIDGSVIRSISRNGVVLRKNGQDRKIGIVSSI